MAALSERKIDVVRRLVESAPDRVVGGLQLALSETAENSALASVRKLVDVEALDRRLRNTVLQAIAPMCVGAASAGSDALTFPRAVLPLLWKGLKSASSRQVRAAADIFEAFCDDEGAGESFDELARIAAYGVRHRSTPEFAAAADLCEQAKPGGAEALAACLDLSAVVRRAVQRIPDWLAHFDEESAAAARLAYKDAVAVSDDAGPRFFEMMAAQLPQPWMVLRVISEVMDKPTERYLADSEMAGFGERVMAEIDTALQAIAKLDPEGGLAAARQAAERVELITLQTAELEACIDLSREHGWGHRIVKQKKALAGVVEGRLREAEKAVQAALPTQPARLKRIRRKAPRLSLPPDVRAVARAATLLAFSQEVRGSANYGGFAAARSKTLESVAEYLHHYVDEAIDLVKTKDAENEVHALAFLEVAAELSGLVHGAKAGDLVRRRINAAHQAESVFVVGD